ncbi:MAG: radical SAM protein [Acidobacteria bacterium]|nr:radical SAM protein [Acidobacteriota bacterium]
MGEQTSKVKGAAAAPSLFDLSPRRPTTRQLADFIKQHRGAGPCGQPVLPDAIRRADDAQYQEVTCRSALNRVEGMPFAWTLNPYRGCTHGCHYCFARRYQTYLELGPGDEFSSLILVKVNFADVLRRELARRTWQGELIGFGTATDPYQPIEGHYRLTRRALEALVDHPSPVGLITKGPMVVRDLDLLVELSRRTTCTVHMSVPTVDEEAWQALEPGTAHPLQRLRAVRTLADAGVDVGVLMAPVVPGLTSQPAKLERTIKAIADHGARFCGAIVMHLEGGTRDHFMRFLSREFPDLAPRVDRLYAGKYASRQYRDQVHGVLELLRRRYGLHGGQTRSRPPGPTARIPVPREEDQGRFSWGLERPSAVAQGVGGL